MGEEENRPAREIDQGARPEQDGHLKEAAGVQEKPGEPSPASSGAPIPPPSARPGPSGMDLQGERRRVTVMFADIAGFTALADRADPEKVRNLVNGCFERLVPVVTKYGGTVEKFIGDAIMAVFGVPSAHENDPERALRSALEMQEALAAFNVAHNTQLGVHIGLNTGLVIAGDVGTTDRKDYTVMGDAVNVASRLADAAQQGQVLVGPDTYRLTSHLFAFQAVGPLRLEGKDEPIPAYELLGRQGQTARLGALEARGISSPLVGREAEVAAFTGCIERLLGGQGSLVSIIAEAGLGKSRLAAEVRQQTTGQHLTWLEGRTLSYGQNISYWPFLEIIQTDAGITTEDGEEQRWEKLERRVNALFPDEAAEFLPYLATLLSLEVPGALAERVRYLDSEAMGRQVFRTARRFLARLAMERPLVLVFEDMHWMDESSALLVEHLLPLAREVPMLICGVGRPDPETAAARLEAVAARDYADCYTRVRLEPLSRADSAQLVHNLVAIDDMPSRLRELILQKAEGNPFFLEEVIRVLIDLGGLVRDRGTGRWRVTAQAGQIAIPDTLQGVIMARIDRLEGEVRDVLKLASVIGRSFFYRVLKAIAEAEQQLDRDLEELQALELVREKARIPELEYIFKHALVQEAAYESLLLQRRRELHRQVGECIEALFPDRLDEFYGLLSYHYTRAEEWAKAQEYLLKAGDQAGKIAADAEALAHYRQALAAYERAFGDRWDPFERAVLERKMGEALFRRGEHEQGRESFLRALSLLGSPYPTSRGKIRLEIGRQLILQVGHRLLSGLLRRHVPASADRVAEERCQIYQAMQWIDYCTSLECLVLDTLLYVNAADQSGLGVHIAVSNRGMGTVCDAIPAPWLARRYHSRAVTTAEQVGHPFALGQTYITLGMHEFHTLGKLEAALEHYRRAATAFWEIGDLKGWSAVNSQGVCILIQRGEFAEGLPIAHDVVGICRDTADPQAIGWGLAVVGRVHEASGRFDEAATELTQAVQLLMGVPDYMFAAAQGGALARCYLRQQKTQEALTVLDETLRLISTHGLRGFSCAEAWVSLARAHVMVMEAATGSARAAAERDAKRSCAAALAQGKLDRSWLPSIYRQQGTFEWLRGKLGRAQRWWQRSLAVAQQQGARYELGMTYLEMGKRLADSRHLEQAEAIFAEIGAQFDLEQARELLHR